MQRAVQSSFEDHHLVAAPAAAKRGQPRRAHGRPARGRRGRGLRTPQPLLQRVGAQRCEPAAHGGPSGVEQRIGARRSQRGRRVLRASFVVLCGRACAFVLTAAMQGLEAGVIRSWSSGGLVSD